jgi:leucyl-tRNA synthetase
MSEELWQRRLGRVAAKAFKSIHEQVWPEWDAALAADEVVTLVVQVNGKVRDRVTVPVDISEAEAKQAALGTEGAVKFMGGKPARQVVYVKGRLVNIVV